MDKHLQLKEQVYGLISSCFNEANIELVDLICRHEGNNLILSIFADRPEGGVTLGECALLNRKVSGLLDEKNIIDSKYVLEVSSPGLDRCLKTQKDFSRCLNKEAVFFLNDLINGKCQWQGLINKVDEAGVSIASCGQILEIPLTKINKAQLVIKK